MAHYTPETAKTNRAKFLAAVAAKLSSTFLSDSEVRDALVYFYGARYVDDYAITRAAEKVAAARAKHTEPLPPLSITARFMRADAALGPSHERQSEQIIRAALVPLSALPPNSRFMTPADDESPARTGTLLYVNETCARVVYDGVAKKSFDVVRGGETKHVEFTSNNRNAINVSPAVRVLPLAE